MDEKKDNGSEEHSNKSVKMSMDQALAEREQLRKSISEILSRSDFKLDELVNKTDEELDSTRASLDHAVPPKMNSVRFGVMGADLSDREKGLTVGDLSVVSAQKRKARGGN